MALAQEIDEVGRLASGAHQHGGAVSREEARMILEVGELANEIGGKLVELEGIVDTLIEKMRECWEVLWKGLGELFLRMVREGRR